MFGVLLTPLSCTSRIARRHDAQSAGRLAIFFAFADQHRLGREHVGRPVQNAPDTFAVPGPSAITIRPALLNVLRLLAQKLKEQLAFLVSVDVLGHDAWCG